MRAENFVILRPKQGVQVLVRVVLTIVTVAKVEIAVTVVTVVTCRKSNL